MLTYIYIHTFVLPFCDFTRGREGGCRFSIKEESPVFVFAWVDETVDIFARSRKFFFFVFPVFWTNQISG